MTAAWSRRLISAQLLTAISYCTRRSTNTWPDSYPAQATTPKVAKTCCVILEASENENPYLISDHLVECDEPDLWLDGAHLVPREELEEGTILFCPACEYNYRLWESVLETSFDEGEDPTTEYGDRVFAVFALESALEDGSVDFSEISAVEHADLQIVKNERRKLEAARAYERAREAAQQAASTKRG